jgi:malonyl-CoA/methylmalonyl-CoA synthetase
MVPALPTIVARAAMHGDRTAIIADERTYTYRDLNDASARIASQLLRGRDWLDDARVAFLVVPSFDHVAIQWGIWRAGGIAVPLPLSHPSAELEYLVRDAEATVIIADADNADVAAALAKSCGARFHHVAELMAAHGFSPGTAGLKPCTTDEPRATEGVPVAQGFSPAQRAMILYTSGTTSRPKGVVTTHANITAQIESLITAWCWTQADRTLLVLPLHHVHGIINVVSCALWSGAVLEILPRFDTETTWNRLASGDLTVFTAVPTVYHRLIRAWDASDPDVRVHRSRGSSSLRLMMSGSAALPRAVLDRWQQITGHVLLERYGMTEVGMVLSNPLNGERRPGYVGHPLPGVSVRLVDGEIHVKGPGVFSEYWRRPEATRESFTDGWFRTGDIAVVEDDYYRLLGRSSVDIVKSGGHKISALEIEEVLRTHPAIGECAVVGVDDDEWGQRVCCAVELAPGRTLELNDLREWAGARLAAVKIPKDLLCVPHLPRNAMGKVVKPEVSALFVRPAPPARRDP